jgi:hypothetical protein
MAILRLPAFSLVMAACLPGAALRAEEPVHHPVFSQHISDAIQAGFRKDVGVAPAAPAARPFAPAEVDPGVVVLPLVKVVDQPPGANLTASLVTPKTEAIPLVLGTGVTEFKGKKYTILVRRILFIPVAFKIEW